MATDSGYEKGNYLRVCDICGHRFHFRDLKPIGELRFACPDDAPGLTSMQISRFNARAKPLIVRPNRWAKDYAQTGIYQLAEAQIFNFVSQVAPAGDRNAANDALAAAWTVVYLSDVLAQDKRPQGWDRTATAAIVRCCTYLLSLQYGSPTGPAPASAASNPRYGGIQYNTDWNTSATVAAGLAFIKAYGALGTSGYRDAAERAATFIRHAQSGDVQVSAYTVYPAGGGPYHIGGLAKSVHDSTGLLDTEYLVADIAGAWFLRLLANNLGDGRFYGDLTATAFFGANAASLATMIAELTAFGETGARDSAESGQFITGLSTTAPSTTYSAATNGGTGAASWATSTRVVTNDIALAVLGIYSANGTTAKVTEMMAWLASFASNVNNRTPAGTPPEEVYQGITGTYSPSLCPADLLGTSAPFTEADGALYDWASLGLLSPILAGNQATFKTSKDQLSTSVRYTTLDITNLWLGPIGSSGLSLQPFARDSLGNIIGAGGLPAPSSATSRPPSVGLVFWVRGDLGLESTAGVATAWRDQSGYGQDITDLPANPGPSTGLDTINGTPAVTFPLANAAGKGLYRTTGVRDRNGNVIGYGVGETQARTFIAILMPRFSAVAFNITGGIVAEFGSVPTFQPIFNLEDNFHVNGFYVWSKGWRDSGTGALQGPDTPGGVGGVYNGVPLLVEWASTGFDNISMRINGAIIPITPSVLPGPTGNTSNPIFSLGRASSGGLNFFGAISEVMIWDHVLSLAEREELTSYVAGSHPSIFAAHPTSFVERAAKTGLLYRQSPGRYPFLRGN